MESAIQKTVVTCLLLNILLQSVQKSEARENVLELVTRLEPQLRERAAAARHLAVPLPDPQFQQLVEAVVRQRVPVHAKSEECRAHSQLVVDAVIRGETWALRMFDASSKFPIGILEGNFVDLGNYHECIGSGEPSQMFAGQHCLVETRGIIPHELHELLNYDLSQVPPEYTMERWLWILDLTFSVCVPTSCSSRDVQDHMDHVLAPINASSRVYDSSCSSAQPLPFRVMDYVAISVFLGILAIVVWSSVSDTLSSGPKSDVVVYFSLARNWRQLTDTRVGSAGDISCLHGLRVMSTAGIVLIHRVTTVIMMINNIPFFLRYNFAVFEFLIRGVDVYFMVGGTVRAYGFFRDRYKGKQLDILSSIGRRYLSIAELHYLGACVMGTQGLNLTYQSTESVSRYTPTLAVVMLYTATLLVHTSKGPMWRRFWDYNFWCCHNNWFLHFFLIQNYVFPHSNCVGESWYLAVDFQMFVFSTFILIPLYFRPKLGITLLTLAGLGTMAVYALTSYAMEVDASSFNLERNKRTEFILGLYFQTHLRAPPYLLGLGLGYLLFTTAQTNRRIRLPKLVLWVGWTLSLASLALLMAATRTIKAIDYQYTPWLDTLYNVLSKFMVAAITAWVVLVCTLGYGGILNDLLSWRGFQPLAKLSFGVYLIHFGLIMMPQYARRTDSPAMDDVTIVYLWLGDLVIATAMAVPLYLCVELPCCQLASKYLTSSVPYDPIIASITAKKLRPENGSASKTHQISTPRSTIETPARKVKKKQ